MKADIKIEFESPLRGSRSDYQEFKESIVWLDIKTFFEERIEDLQRKLERAETLYEVREYQAALRNSRDFLDLPDIFILEVESTKPIEQKEEEPDHE